MKRHGRERKALSALSGGKTGSLCSLTGATNFMSVFISVSNDNECLKILFYNLQSFQTKFLDVCFDKSIFLRPKKGFLKQIYCPIVL